MGGFSGWETDKRMKECRWVRSRDPERRPRALQLSPGNTQTPRKGRAALWCRHRSRDREFRRARDFVAARVCGIMRVARLTLTLGVQFHLVLFQERQKDGAPSKMANSWDGIAGRHQFHRGRSSTCRTARSRAGRGCFLFSRGKGLGPRKGIDAFTSPALHERGHHELKR